MVDPALAADSLVPEEAPLTPRGAGVLPTAAEGCAVVARRMHLSEGTVPRHLSPAMAKTTAATQAEAVRTVVERGRIVG